MFRWPWRSRPDLVSSEWLQNQARRESRIEFQGVKIKFPINKFVNEHPRFQTFKLRKRA